MNFVHFMHKNLLVPKKKNSITYKKMVKQR